VISKKRNNLPFGRAERKGERDACGLRLPGAAKSAQK
jgi:hypothetical protein